MTPPENVATRVKAGGLQSYCQLRQSPPSAFVMYRFSASANAHPDERGFGVRFRLLCNIYFII